VNAPPDPTPSVVLVLTTVGVAADAVAIARTLVEERLAACVHVLPPMTSVYRWKDQVEEDRERQIVMKTTRERVGALEARLRALHPYELPEFLIVQADGGSDAYLAWVIENVRPVKRT
jgi:periplasmic divalent cation tolerance protein